MSKIPNCFECGEACEQTGRNTWYCPSCDVCPECFCPQVDNGGHYPECSELAPPIQYANIVFAQGDDATEPLEILDRDGEQAAIEYLAQWDYGEYHEVREAPAAGASDYTFKSGAYVLSYNLRMGYIGLERIID